ncbi:MAG: C-terminal binding protein [Phoenicibacter congonensis]|uniref:C-terminal binding protein n=1 Tax=Phoenicibacter congonensis TaxID=1944646 RepID=A0AA43RIP0_9ACTN|nr:C-terminal binding protein [Phoenicibacter congonensis]
MALIVDVETDLKENDIEIAMANEAGIDFIRRNGRTPADAIKNLSETGADAALTSYTLFTREVFEACPNLKVVSRTGVGYDEIDVEAATEHGVAVCNVPGYANEAVSDHAIALAMASLRRINESDANLRKGIWGYQQVLPLGQAQGRTFGVIGMGAIGRTVALKAKGLGFRVVCWSRSGRPQGANAEEYEWLELDQLVAQADIISLHTALTPETKHLIDERRIKMMKPTAIVVNTARGKVVDTVALAKALTEGRIWGAGLDVFEQEQPFDFEHPIMKAPHTVLSSHAAFASTESLIELRTRAMQACIDVCLGKIPVDCLNPEVFG